MSQPEGMSSFSPISCTPSASSVASTSVDDIFSQVMGRERHGCKIRENSIFLKKGKTVFQWENMKFF